MEPIRGFEVVSAYAGRGLALPERKTAESAGYDIASAEDVVLAPQEVTLIPTGLKAFMGIGEYLAVYIRSGISIRNRLLLINGTGIIDSDYYNNEENEGHIMIAVYNAGKEPFAIRKGERIAQGIFTRYLLVADDEATGVRVGGIGSTGM